jgi:hypothetical protein
MPTTEKQKEAHVKLGTEAKVVNAGETTVSVLKQELRVDPADVLWLVKGNERRPLADHETINVESGMHFEAIGGGGVS